MLGMVRDANGGGIAFDAHPFVRFGVSQIRRNIRHKRIESGTGALVNPLFYRSVLEPPPPQNAGRGFQFPWAFAVWRTQASRSPCQCPCRAMGFGFRWPP